MSCPEADRQARAPRSRSGSYDVIVCNFANADMVGHTGNLAAAIQAVRSVDVAVGRIVDAIRAAGGALLVTADHGNCEMMRDPEHRPAAHRAHRRAGAAGLRRPAPGVRCAAAAPCATSRRPCSTCSACRSRRR